MNLPRAGKFNRGRWEIERERGRIGDEMPPPPPGNVRPVGQTIMALMRKLDRQTPPPGPLDLLTREWSLLAGQELARISRPGRFEKGRLVIFAKNSVWLNELARQHKARLIDVVRRRVGADVVKEIGFAIDPERRS